MKYKLLRVLRCIFFSNPPYKAMDASRFINQKSASRKPSAIRALQKYTSDPQIISLGGGIPHPCTFPITGLTIATATGSLQVDTNILQVGLQYSQTAGIPALLEYLTKLQQLVHNPPAKFDICLGGGSQDVLSKAFDMLVNEGDAILIECPAYVGILAHLRPYNLNFQGN